MKILIDADGCPVTRLTHRIASERGIECVIFCDTAHEFDLPGAEVVTVSTGADSADFALVNRASAGDIVVTQDWGLAALCLARGARPIDQNGRLYTDENIGGMLEARCASAKLRRAGVRMKGPSRRSHAQDADFEAALIGLLKI